MYEQFVGNSYMVDIFFCSFMKLKQNFAEICWGPPLPKLRYMVGDKTSKKGKKVAIIFKKLGITIKKIKK